METTQTQKVLKEYPLAAKYLKDNSYIVIVTPDDGRPKEIETSTSLIVNATDHKIPGQDILGDLYNYCQEIAYALNIQDFQLGISVVENGERTVREIRFNEGYCVRVTSASGQMAEVFFDSYEEFMMLYPILFRSKTVDHLFYKKVGSERQALFISDNPPPEGWTGLSLMKSDLLLNEKNQANG